jgi:hypothetical protein
MDGERLAETEKYFHLSSPTFTLSCNIVTSYNNELIGSPLCVLSFFKWSVTYNPTLLELERMLISMDNDPTSHFKYPRMRS